MAEERYCDRDRNFFLPLIIVVGILSVARLWFLRDIFWDDNCWILSAYSTGRLKQFLDMGFTQLRRVPLGIFQYYFYSLHKKIDYAYPLWNSASIFIQIVSSVYLYTLLNNLFKTKRFFAFFAAIAFIIFPIHTALPFYGNLPYRLGVMFTIISFYLTERALARDARWVFLTIALILSGISHYVLIEGAVALEPARLFFIWYILSKKPLGHKALLNKTLMTWFPFFLLCLPISFYKMAYKPFGVCSGIYAQDVRFFLDGRKILFLLAMLMSYHWISYLKNGIIFRYSTSWSMSLGLVAFFLCLYLLNRADIFKPVRLSLKAAWISTRDIFILAAVLLIPPILLYLYTDRAPGIGFQNRHGIILQFGDAVLIGGLIYFLYCIFYAPSIRSRWMNLFIAFCLAAGVLFNNINIDLYFKAWDSEKKFWNAFTMRFPSLPPNATFLIDAIDDTPLKNSGVRSFHSLEFSLNVLYTDSKDPVRFLKYKAIALGEWELLRRSGDEKPSTCQRITNLGEEMLDPKEFIVVRYRDNELFVNGEILTHYPDISYKDLLHKDFPILPPPGEYPLRYKLKELVFQGVER